MPLNDDRIVTLNCGMGRDSIAMICLCCEGKLHANGWYIQPEDLDVVVFSNTGNEWPGTYEHVVRIRKICADHDIRFMMLDKGDMDNSEEATSWAEIQKKARGGAYHYRPDIMDDFKSRDTVASLGKGDCTDNQKIQPIRRTMNDISLVRFGLNNRQWSYRVREKGFEPHLNLIGIAADETTRIPDKDIGPKYCTEAYPLAEMGLAKADETPILERWDLNHVRKSGCFMCCRYDTPVVTKKGVRPIGDLSGGNHELLIPTVGSKGGLSYRGTFKSVPVKHFGEQKIWEVHLKRQQVNRVIHTTAEHRWFLEGESQWRPMSDYERTTESLQKGDRLRILRAQKPNKEKLMPSAAAQGFVFGDGTRGQGDRPASVIFFDHKQEMLKYFVSDGCEVEMYDRTHRRIYGVPRFWKNLPDIDSSRSFLLSWLAGYFAADGCVSKRGHSSISSSDIDNISFVRDAASLCGVPYGSICENNNRSENYINDGTGSLYSIGLRAPWLPDWFFLLSKHRERIENHDFNDYDYPWIVEKVVETDETDDVYCAVVPKAGAFGLVRGLMTGNCPYQPAGWYWALSVKHPHIYKKVVDYEANALARNPRMAATGFKKGGEPMRIPEVVEKWRRKNPDAEVDEVLDKSYSRCTKEVRTAQKKEFAQ